MINFFKKLFAAIFGKKKSSPSHKKPIVEEPIILLDEMKMPKESQQPEPKNELVKEKKFFPFSGRKKWQMRNNRLHIEYNGEARASGINFFVDKDENKNIIRMHRPGSMYKGKIESLRCTRLERADQIIRLFRSSIKRAVFTDKEGNQYQLV